MTGWLKIDRAIKDHWIWKDPVKLKWWIDILISVNFKEGKINIGNTLIECKRGQSIMSLSEWAKRWKVDKNKVRNFFVLLEKDGMITHENLSKTTRITVCNYDSYQSEQNANETQSKRKRNAIKTQSNPIEEGEEDLEGNNDKKFNAKKFLLENLASLEFIDEWFVVRKAKGLSNTKTAMEDFMSEVKKSNMNIDEVLKKCVISSWGGFKYSWILNEKNKGSANNTPTTTPNYHVPGEILR